MPSRVPTDPDHHQRRQTAALITGAEAERAAFLDGLLEDADLCQGARRGFLKLLQRQGVSGALFTLAAEDALCTVLRAAFRRLDALLQWDAAQAPLAAWWGQQALFEFNNDGRRQAEKQSGYWRSSGDTYVLGTDHVLTDEGEWQLLDWADEQADPADGYERRTAPAELERLLRLASDSQAAQWLRVWLAADALHEEQPLTVSHGTAQLVWRHGQQQTVAATEGVSTRTLRTRTRRVEQMLSVVVGQ
ncbi:hypothetical protein E7T06_05345 [Deinococcus sp. Arct2-2]|nr:hypothetical protein E7T06_05345 [Deinococcus sp. Arct2-2]